MGDRGWMKIVAVVLLVAAAGVLIARLAGVGGGFDPNVSGESVAMVCEETGETWEMERGHLMTALYNRPDMPIDPSVGLASPANGGKPTAFPKDRGLWEKLVKQVNREKEVLLKP